MRLKGRLSPWAASASVLGRVLARDRVDKKDKKKGKPKLGDQVFVPHFTACCQLFSHLKQLHGRQHRGNTGKRLEFMNARVTREAAVVFRGLKFSFNTQHLLLQTDGLSLEVLHAVLLLLLRR